LSLIWKLLGRGDDPEEMSVDRYVDLAYRFILGRRPDAHGQKHFEDRLQKGAISRGLLLQTLIDSQEFARNRLRSDLSTSFHESRGRFVRSFPPARRIVDLGGSCEGRGRWSRWATPIDSNA
jgi:hypothetical protein